MGKETASAPTPARSLAASTGNVQSLCARRVWRVAKLREEVSPRNPGNHLKPSKRKNRGNDLLMATSTMLALVVGVATTAAIPQHVQDAQDACKQLNFSQKVGMMHGYGEIDGYSRNSGCGGLCGRATFRWDNGPQGFGDHTIPGSSTQWPSTLNMGSSFDPALALEWGTAMGEEFWGKGTNIQEGPGINIARVMRNGRNWEYVSGEDPVLGATIAPAITAGINKNVMSVAKHYILNNQETDRSGVNELIDEKTLMELYGPPFDAAVQEASAVMCAYNRINGDWACENELTLNTMLKTRYNFSGWVVSDWGACHSTSPALERGLDVEMPNDRHFNEDDVKTAIDAGNTTMDRIDDVCVRILSQWYKLPEGKRYPCVPDGKPGTKICINNNVSTPEHKQLARKISAMTTVLLKNDNGLLPLSPDNALKIAVIGKNAGDKAYTAGGGSGSVSTNALVSPLAALSAMGGKISVTYCDGKDKDEAVAAAKAADIAMVFGVAEAHEGSDRDSLSLKDEIDDLIPAVAAAAPANKTVVVMTVPGSILTPWRDDVAAILSQGFPGEQVGNALVDILFGNVPPQAKLPVTFPNKENEQGFTKEQYPGVPAGGYTYQANYTEGQINGYRWYDKNNVKPAFEFGFGLTYGPAFDYSKLSIDAEKRTISFQVARKGTGRLAGCETPQVYFGYPNNDEPNVPTKVLRFFKKVCDNGDGDAFQETLSYSVSDRDVSNWDVAAKQWAITKGKYTVSVGGSSRDIRLAGSLTV